VKRIACIVLMVSMLVIAACGGQPAPEPTAEPPATAVPTKAIATELVPPTDIPATVELPTEEPFESPISPGAATEEPFESPLKPADDTFESPIGMPNPASVHCAEQGYVLEIRTEAAGQAGYCIFPDGTECEEWAFFRGECGPGTPAP
jgi:putative hemolysin